jgi:hypothetical protein
MLPVLSQIFSNRKVRVQRSLGQCSVVRCCSPTGSTRLRIIVRSDNSEGLFLHQAAVTGDAKPSPLLEDPGVGEPPKVFVWPRTAAVITDAQRKTAMADRSMLSGHICVLTKSTSR